MFKHIFRQKCCKLLVVLLLSIFSFCNHSLIQFLVTKWLSLNYLFYFSHLFYLIPVIHLCQRCIGGFVKTVCLLILFLHNSSENSGDLLIGDGDDTEIQVTEGAIQTVKTDDLGTQKSKEAISQQVDENQTVIPVEDKNETTEEQQIITGKMIGINDLTTTIVFFIVILNYHRHYFIKIRMIRANKEISR